jgi:hypothetical protein
VAIDSSRILKLLAKDPKYRKKFGTTVGDTRKIAQLLKKGAKVSGYMAKDGGYIVKKRKKTVKKRKK